MKSIHYYGGVFMLLLAAACTPTVIDKPPAAPQVMLKLEPQPGSYPVYRLDVTVTTEPDHELFFALDREPELIDARAYDESFSLRLVRSARLFVSVRSPDNVVHGPFEFQYSLTPLASSGTCQIAALPKQYYRKEQSIALNVQYVLPAAAARVEIGLNGVWEQHDVDEHLGSLSPVMGPFPEGVYTVGCRVMLGDQVWTGNTIAFTVDGTPPTGNWITGSFQFDQYTWRNAIHVSAADALSGLARVDLCSAETQDCLGMSDRGAGVFAYATALTDGSNFTAEIYVRIVDVAGNERLLSTKALDFSAFADPVPLRMSASLQSITLTTDAQLDLNLAVGAGWEEAWQFDGSSILPGALVALEPGWNEFLYRYPGTGHWDSYGIYQAGVEVHLPPTNGQWLIFSGVGDMAGWPAILEAVVPGNPSEVTVWKRPWFAVPNLFFVEDLAFEERWSNLSDLHVDATVDWARFGRAWAEPVVIEPVPYAPSPTAPAYAQLVSVSVAGGLPAGEIYFQWRATFEAFPSHHEPLAMPYSFPLAVSVPVGGHCMFFLDTQGHGVIFDNEPRAWGPCDGGAFTIDYRAGPLVINDPFIMGIPYGGTVTGTIFVTTSGGDPVASYPIPNLHDASGLGRRSFLDGLHIRHPGLPARLHVYHENQSAQFQPDTGSLPPSYGTISAAVTDQAGGALHAMIVTLTEGQLGYGVTGDIGYAPWVPVAGPAPHTVYAVRDGWLSEKAVTDGTSVNVRLLSALHAKMLSGTVTSAVGPVAYAELAWENDDYFSQTRADADGFYALPVSGLSGTLRVSSASRSVSFPLEIAENASFDVTLPHEASLAWPMGLGESPDWVVGPSSALLASSQNFYTLTVTGESEGVWKASWDDRFLRYFTIEGALPPSPSATWQVFDIPSSQGLQRARSYARCGDVEQPVFDVIIAQHPCWHWLGEDGLQIFALGRQLAGVYPQSVGLALLGGSLVDSGGSLVEGTYVLTLVDRLLPGRIIRVAALAGSISAAVPPGIYEVKTPEGNPVLINGGMLTKITVRESGDSYSFRLP